VAVAFAPGRVNLVGEHTDYNDGLALAFALSVGVRAEAVGRTDGRVHARALDLGEEDEFPLDAIEPAAGWRAFVRGTVAELRAAGHDLSGADVEFSGDVPRGGGLASSAALTVALALALMGEEDFDRVALAKLCSRVENEWVGARTGLLDQLASLLGREGHALRIDFRALAVTPVALELGPSRLVVLGSGETHDLAASGYNQRRAECERARELLGLESLRDAQVEDLPLLPDPLDRRVRHLLAANMRVGEAVAALEREDLAALGPLLDASHTSLRDLYDASTPAVERTVDALRAAGAAGARMMGGGFGGSVLALLPPGVDAPDGAVEVRPGPGARLLR